MTGTISSQAATKVTVKVGNKSIDVTGIAKENGVDPYELKKAIENGKNTQKASPFSNLATTKSGKKEAEIIETISARAGTTATRTKVTKKNQDSTAYVAKKGSLTASGKTPQIGMCAMHTNVTTKTGETTSKVIKLGATLHMEEAVNINGITSTSFIVEDRGAPKNRTKYWIDVYFGLNNSTNYQAAINYGIKKVSYFYYY